MSRDTFTMDQKRRLCALLDELAALAEELPDAVTDAPGPLGDLFTVLDFATKHAADVPAGGAA